MGLAPGSKLGSYEIIGLLGAGGMGTVYRARDSKLHRDVALKVLPDSFTQDPVRVARFRREAQVLASVNHAHIGGIHGLEDANGVTALVLELVDGPTLAERIARGPLPLDETLSIAAQVADALEAAHERGIIHRDLKPSNIKVRADGTVKVLDFGLAKAVDVSASSADTSRSPTLTAAAMTEAGLVVGTAAYMSPEQARGQAVDKRTDIWAFGCVLFEMLTGAAAFQGQSVSDVIASVLRAAPDWSALPLDAVPLTGVLQRCLEKDVRRRLRDIGDAKLLLEGGFGSTPGAASGASEALASSRRAWRAAVAGLVGVVLGGTSVALVMRSRSGTAPARVERFELKTSQALPFTADLYGANVAISPDATRLVYSATRRGIPALVVRALEQLEPTVIAGTENGFDPFFSPDGQHIGFATFTELKSVATAGGPSVTICPVDAYFSGASWGPDNTIVFAQGTLGLFRTTASGGQGERIADHVTAVVEGGFGPRYLSSGHLVYGLGDRLMAVRFDANTLQATGSPVSLQEGVFNKVDLSVANIASATDGTMVYVSGQNSAGSGRLVWIDRRGTQVEAIRQPIEEPRNIRLSPDGKRVARQSALEGTARSGSTI